MRTCFVISPIGKPGTPSRANADDVFELLIEPALEPFQFEVIRADKIAGPAVITDQILRLVREADLCIVDLTEHNPNVFYECGRRHESGKPAILIKQKDESIPFDLAGINTIDYDFTDPRTTRASVMTVQDSVRELERSGFEESSSGASLTTVIQTLERIERKLTGVKASEPLSGLSSPRPGGLKALMRNPQVALKEAIRRGDVPAIVSLLPWLEKTLGPSDALVAAAGIAATQGEETAAEVLYRVLSNQDKDLPEHVLVYAASSLVQFYMATNRSRDSLERLPDVLDQLMSRQHLTPKTQAIFHNQLQMLYFAADQHEQALEASAKAIEMNPEEASYRYNASLIYDRLQQPKKALEMVQQYMAIGTDDEDLLSHAFKAFRDNGLQNEASGVFARLQELDPFRAELALNGED